MAYVKPRGFTRRVVNPLVSRLHSGGFRRSPWWVAAGVARMPCR